MASTAAMPAQPAAAETPVAVAAAAAAPATTDAPAASSTAAETTAAPAAVSSPPAAAADPGTPGIAIDPDHADDDEFDSDAASSTASLTESVLDFRKLHGRTYHNYYTATEYWGPNDDRQNMYLDLNHEMLLLAWNNRLFRAPIGDNPQRVLDVGTGTGIWAIDFADQYPGADVIGTDISPTQANWVPPNCRFELDDAQQEWTYPDNHFDYIHIRLMMGAIADWPALYKEVFRCLKPGGWFEQQEFDPRVVSDDGSVGPDSPWQQWGNIFLTAGEKLGRTFSVIIDSTNVGWFKDAGFQNVSEDRVKLPLGMWPAKPELKTVGNYNLSATAQGLEGFALYVLTEVHGWDLAKTQIYLATVRKELHNRTVHSYYETSAVWGQKPGK